MIQPIIEVLKVKSYDDYFVRNDVLHQFKDSCELLVVPQEMQNEVIQMCSHSKGHLAVKRTKEGIKQEVYSPMLRLKM